MNGAKLKKLAKMEAERAHLRLELDNEFKFFDATDEFRDGALPWIIAMMRRYDKIQRHLSLHRGEVFSRTAEEPLAVDPPPVEGDTLHFSKSKD